MANQPITIVNRFSAGASNDIVLRISQEALEKAPGQLEKARAEVAKVLRAIPGTRRQISAFKCPQDDEHLFILACRDP